MSETDVAGGTEAPHPGTEPAVAQAAPEDTTGADRRAKERGGGAVGDGEATRSTTTSRPSPESSEETSTGQRPSGPGKGADDRSGATGAEQGGSPASTGGDGEGAPRKRRRRGSRGGRKRNRPRSAGSDAAGGTTTGGDDEREPASSPGDARPESDREDDSTTSPTAP